MIANASSTTVSFSDVKNSTIFFMGMESSSNPSRGQPCNNAEALVNTRLQPGG
jgi:hypothetical protein